MFSEKWSTVEAQEEKRICLEGGSRDREPIRYQEVRLRGKLELL